MVDAGEGDEMIGKSEAKKKQRTKARCMGWISAVFFLATMILPSFLRSTFLSLRRGLQRSSLPRYPRLIRQPRLVDRASEKERRNERASGVATKGPHRGGNALNEGDDTKRLPTLFAFFFPLFPLFTPSHHALRLLFSHYKKTTLQVSDARRRPRRPRG